MVKATAAPRVRRLNRRVDQLALYNEAFGGVGNGDGARIEVEIRVTPGDEIADVRIRMPKTLIVAASEDQPVVLVSRISDDAQSERPVEIGSLADDGTTSPTFQRRQDATAVFVDQSEAGMTQTGFLGWEVITPLDGVAPYLVADLAIRLQFPTAPATPVVVTVVTPDSVTPRAIRGNHVLAYPSRTFEGRRYLNVYYATGKDVRLVFRSGDTKSLTAPWTLLGRAGVSATFAYLVGILADSVDRSERFLALVASFIAVATVTWDIIQEISRFRIYNRQGRGIDAFVIGVQLLVLTGLALSLIGLSDNTSSRILPVAAIVAALAAVLSFGGAMVGFALHQVGWWHSYTCDHQGCQSRFRVRRLRPECRYTGRVFCDSHIDRLCRTCVHGEDLLNGSIDSLQEYRAANLLCVDVTSTSITALRAQSSAGDADQTKAAP